MGQIIVSMIMIFGVIYMAMPLTIVGEAFSHTWRDRGRIILIARTRDRLIEWGYSERELETLFAWFDRDAGGTLDVNEFAYMMSKFRLGLRQSSVEMLFEYFDKDGDGQIEIDEFKKAMSLPKMETRKALSWASSGVAG